jgi:hypothetical protein
MSSTSLQIIPEKVILDSANPIADRVAAFPWKDPFSIPQEQLDEIISSLKNACAKNPPNAALQTCLGMAHAMNYDVNKSMDALETACKMAPQNFFAQFKYSELFFRLRLMDRAEEETSRAMELANTASEISLVGKQLSEIRRLKRKGVARPAWTKSLGIPTAGIVLLLLVISVFNRFPEIPSSALETPSAK